ncbi:MAG: T9SS type A sorting domain-containing protein [Rhodothermales bacterium]
MAIDPVASDDELAVLTPEGACAGTLTWDAEMNATAMAVWEDNPVTALKDGFVPGDTLRYGLWDASSGREVQGSVVRYEPYADPSGIFSPEAVYFVAELAFGETMVATGDDEAPEFAFTFEPNYPNPFATSTTFRYAIPETTHVRLEVYDLLGRRVATLADEDALPGWHERRFDADGLANGAYIARLTAGTHSDTQRITLLRGR